MLEKLMAFCLRNRLTVIIITLVLAALSIFGIMRTPVDVFPELYVPRVTIQTEAGGLTAEEVEQYVSIPLRHPRGAAGAQFQWQRPFLRLG